MKMKSEVIQFSKSFEQRSEDYAKILCTHEVLGASDVLKEWSYHAEMVLEPSGWQALWKISRRKCNILGVPFPAAVLVMVESTDTETLTAKVKIVENPDHLDISKLQEAALVNLYPTVDQNYKLMNIHETADYLDKLRFFYDNVWQPWDIEDDEKQDWPTVHLEKRLKLYYDIQSGKVPPDIVKRIQTLMQEARSLHYSIEKLENEIDDEDDVDSAVFYNLMDLHAHLDKVKNEFEIYESPHTRNIQLMKKQHNRQSLTKTLDSTTSVCLIWPGGSVDDYINFLQVAKSHIDKEAFVSTTSKLQNALDQTLPGSTVLLSTGMHGILGLGEFEKGGTIKGISTSEIARLSPSGAGNVLLNCIGGEITLENLIVDSQQLQIAIASCDTTLRLQNCQVVGQSGGSTTEGLLALRGAKLLLEDCHILGFGTGLVVHSQAEVSLISCKITSCQIGIMVFNGGKLSIQKCTISDCLEYGVKAAISKQNFAVNNVGHIELLNSVGEVVVKNSSVLNNGKGDVCIVQTHVNAGYDRDSPTFSFLLSSDGLKYDEMEQENKNLGVIHETDFEEPINTVLKNEGKGEPANLPIEIGVSTYSGISSITSVPSIQKAQEFSLETDH